MCNGKVKVTMRVLHCPSDVGNTAWGLSRAERELGIKSDMMVFKSQWFGYPADINLHFERSHFLTREYKKWKFFISNYKKYDVFNFNYTTSILDYRLSFFLNYIDLPLLKRSGKKIVMTIHDCNARIMSYCIKNFETSACAECDHKLACTIKNKLKERRIQKLLKYADKIYALNPDLIHTCPSAEFQPYSNVILDEWVPSNENNEDDTIKILHAPSNRSIKGTSYILSAFKKLKSEGYPVELLLVENIPNNKAKEFYQKADIVIDQLLIGWYGGFAVEMMALEKPVLCYLRDSDLDMFVPFKDKIPIVNITKDTLYEKLITLIEDPKLRKKIGKKSRGYVEEIHDPIKIAKKLIRDAYTD